MVSFRLVFKIALVLLIFSGITFAANRAWFIRAVEPDGNPITPSHAALALRSNATWPVVATDSGTAAMGVTGWRAGPSGSGTSVTTATSANGRIGFAYTDGNVQFFDQNGWSSSSYGGEIDSVDKRAPIDFSSGNLPSVLHSAGDGLTLARYNGYTWYQDVVKNDVVEAFQANEVAFAYDSYDQANIAYYNSDSLKFAFKGVTTNHQWQFETIDTAAIIDIDLAIDTNDKPWVAYSESGTGISIKTYDPITFSWTNTLVDSSFDTDNTNHFDITADSKGGTGIAYVNTNNELIYRYNNGTGIWSDEAVIDFETGTLVQAVKLKDVSLAFDAGDNPVISFGNVDDNEELYLAYDPIVVPEPATLTCLLAGLTLIRKRRQA